ncbi:STAS domain-containing protein [Pseudomonas oryzihabitans]|uniref:STAS domain-containing protein n=1 Tax=Pseudomonas oryzihabitans TaxID=47885 RepID=UPI00135E26D6|nr:STAS domain-containing protein [Pseudomonas oryzihabitans]MXS21562.1 STAS domain-containing protein [Pseudomonas oryzihabitans]
MSAVLTLPRDARLPAIGDLFAHLEGITVVDASETEWCDTSTLSLLLACARQARRQGKTLTLLAPPPQLRRLAQLHGVEDLLFAGSP